MNTDPDALNYSSLQDTVAITNTALNYQLLEDLLNIVQKYQPGVPELYVTVLISYLRYLVATLIPGPVRLNNDVLITFIISGHYTLKLHKI